MNIRPHSLALNLALSASIVLLAAGCNRQETRTSDTPTPATTTIGTEIDDTVVTSKIKSALMEDQDTKGFDIKVETRKGGVQLSGFVDSRFQADRAVTIARATEGAKKVEDNMTLKTGKETVGNQIDDSVITTRVRSALVSDPSIKSFDIAVATRKGAVQLSGFVDNQAQIDNAIATTRGVEGVQSVINQIAIKK